MIEKKRSLRRIEFVLTNDKINPIAFYEFYDEIIEDGLLVSTNTHRQHVDPRVALEEVQKKI